MSKFIVRFCIDAIFLFIAFFMMGATWLLNQDALSVIFGMFFLYSFWHMAVAFDAYEIRRKNHKKSHRKTA